MFSAPVSFSIGVPFPSSSIWAGLSDWQWFEQLNAVEVMPCDFHVLVSRSPLASPLASGNAQSWNPATMLSGSLSSSVERPTCRGTKVSGWEPPLRSQARASTYLPVRWRSHPGVDPSARRATPADACGAEMLCLSRAFPNSWLENTVSKLKLLFYVISSRE